MMDTNTRRQVREALAERTRQAQEALRAELTKTLEDRARDRERPGPVPETPTPLSLERRYELFRSSVELAVKPRAPKATIVVDRVGQLDAFVELSQAGVTVTRRALFALNMPMSTGAAVGIELCSALQYGLGGRELTAGTKGEPK